MNTKTKILLCTLIAGAFVASVITEPNEIPAKTMEESSITFANSYPVEIGTSVTTAKKETSSNLGKAGFEKETTKSGSLSCTSGSSKNTSSESAFSKNVTSKETTSKTTNSKGNASVNKTSVTEVKALNVKAEATSVSSIKLTWKAEEKREYNIEVYTNVGYVENIYFAFKDKGLCYITGLRENSKYDITITPILTDKEKKSKKFKAVSGKACTSTKSVGEVIQEYECEDGWTSCFAGERASGLTAMPSSGAIYGSKVDEVTGTGIRRFENGDYCCAMGEWYGECGDRFLVELENGIQFTVRICDSKGWADDADGDGEPDGRFHWFGGEGNGKCVIEFIYDDGNLPGCVAFSGSWGYYNWNGLNLDSNIKQIQKLATW